MKVKGLIGSGADTVRGQQALKVVDEWQKRGGSQAELVSLKAGLPLDVKRAVDDIIKRSGLDRDSVRKLRQARITELLVQDDPELVTKGIALSQKEDGVGNPGQQVNVQLNHWSQPPPDGGTLCADKED